MTEDQNRIKDFDMADDGDSLFDLYDKTRSYVRITEDDGQAWLYLMPKEDKSPYTKEELIALLQEHEVVAGINEDRLIAMAKKCVYEREIKVAESVPPKAGRDGYYEYFFDINGGTGRPKIREDGSVDYQSMNMIHNVRKGTVLAKYHPMEPGTPGRDVRGFAIPVSVMKNLPPIQGRGIVHDPENENIYLAERDGKVEYQDGKLTLSNVYQISGDVDQIIGKVEFYGDVVISGNVEAGTVIRAGKSLTIEGTVEAAELFAGGDIILKRGIQGAKKAKITCRGTLFADFIEHTQIKTGGNVEANIILNSDIEADGKVILTGKKGTLIGGNVHGAKGIDCKELGNDVEVKTVVHAGVLPEIFLKQRKLLKEEEDLKRQQEKLLQEVKEIELRVKMTGGLTDSMKVRLKEIAQEKKDLDEEAGENRDRLGKIQQIINQCRGAKVRIDGHLYKGSIICIDQCRMPVENSTVYMEYRNISGMIAGSVIVKN